jgi:hypothetical protein
MVVGDGKSYTVAETAAVKRLIGEGRLVQGSAKVEAKAETKNDVPPLRNATEEEEDAAGLKTETEKETAKVPTRNTR